MSNSLRFNNFLPLRGRIEVGVRRCLDFSRKPPHHKRLMERQTQQTRSLRQAMGSWWWPRRGGPGGVC